MSDQNRGTSQQQFLDVIDRDEAERRFLGAISTQPLGEETVALTECWGRILSRDVVAQIDVPSFDRSNLDGFAVRAADTVSATEHAPRRLKLSGEVIPTAVVPSTSVSQGCASPIATGGMLPRGADAIVMIEHTELDGDDLLVRKSVSPGAGISFAGTDIGAGETVLRKGEPLTSRETGLLAAIGQAHVTVHRRPKVAIISTGDEVIEPTSTMQPGLVFDSNAQILADAVNELGGVAVRLGIVPDDLNALRASLRKASTTCDIVLLSGGTSKGEGDLCYRAVRELNDPGIVAHGVALKPGKPICLASSQGKPIVILPGFPTSAVFTFHEFVAPVVRMLAGSRRAVPSRVNAEMAVRLNSEIGRTEYLLVGLVERTSDVGQQANVATEVDGTQHGSTPLAAYPMGKGSGSVTTFSRADGFVTIGRHQEIVQRGQQVDVQLLSHRLERADLVVIGSHCVGVDVLLGELQELGFRSKFLAVGSTGGLLAASRGECDLAGIHLLDPETGQYNRPFLRPGLELIPGYIRQQGIIFRRGDDRFENRSIEQAIQNAVLGDHCVMVNRNQGSGTRILIDRLLGGKKPEGYAVQPKSHNAVAAAVSQGRADWGVAIKYVADHLQLGFTPIAEEQFDFVVPRHRLQRPAVQAIGELLRSRQIHESLAQLGLLVRAKTN